MANWESIIEGIFLIMYVISTGFILYFFHSEGKDERGNEIFAKASRKTFFILILTYIGIIFFERIDQTLSESAFRSLMFYLIFGSFLVLASFIQYYRVKE